jgi:hypothetical protein
MKFDMQKAHKLLQEAMITKGMDACHVCGRQYRDYEQTYQGLTEQGEALVVCVDCMGRLKYGAALGVYAPIEPDMDAYRSAFYSHPWNKPGKVSGTH